MLRTYVERLEPYAPTVLRVMVGITLLLTGLPKIQNPAGFLASVTSLGFPAPHVIGRLPIILEPIGGAPLILGLGTRWLGLGTRWLGLGTRWLGLYLVLEMAITTLAVKVRRGTPFIMPGNKPGVGFEIDLLILAGALVLVVLGSGALSIEQNVLKREL